MEKSEVYQRTLNLGKLIVNELQLEQSVDTLGRWMAHYLAIKMSEVEHATGNEKIRLEKECFDIILKIWSHRWKISENSRPFRNFEPIFELLVKLSPERKRSFYFESSLDDRKVDISEEQKLSKSDVWLELAKDVDNYARICITQALHSSALELSTTQQEEWLKCAPQLKEDFDVKIIKFILHKDKDIDLTENADESKQDLMKKIKVEKLKSDIEFLHYFKAVHSKLLKALEKKLTNLE